MINTWISATNSKVRSTTKLRKKWILPLLSWSNIPPPVVGMGSLCCFSGVENSRNVALLEDMLYPMNSLQIYLGCSVFMPRCALQGLLAQRRT